MSNIYLPKGALNQKNNFLVAVARGDAAEAQRQLGLLKVTGRSSLTHQPNEDGLFPIHLAAAQGSEAVCRLLVKHGAKVNEVTGIEGDEAEKRTCLHLAAMAGNEGCMKFLISAGADPHAPDAFGKKPYTLCGDPKTRRYLMIAMESWNNVTIAKDLLMKAVMAQTLILRQPSTMVDSLHPKRLVATYDTWYEELQHIRTQNGVHIPISSPPKPSFLRESKNNLKVGLFSIIDRRQEAETKNPFGAIVHARSVKYLGDDSIVIEAFFVRKDFRRQRMGTLIMYHLLTTFAKAQFCHALCSIADANHVAQTFFMKMGFRKLLPDSVPAEHRKPLHSFFEVHYMGLTLAKIERYLDHYQDVKIIDDDNHLEEENRRVREARQRRIDEKKEKKKQGQVTEHGAFFLALEKSLGIHGDRAQQIAKGTGKDVGWWLKDPPVPVFHMGKRIPLIEIPQPPADLKVEEPFLPPVPPAELADSPVRRGSIKRAGSFSLPQVGDKSVDEDDDDGYARVSKITTELDRVPEHVLHRFERDVLFHRDMATQSAKLLKKNEGRLSKILRHEDSATTRDYMKEFEHYQTTYTLKRNLFPENVVGAQPKPKFNPSCVESPSWNRGSQKQGYNFTEGRKSRNKGRFLVDD